MSFVLGSMFECSSALVLGLVATPIAISELANFTRHQSGAQHIHKLQDLGTIKKDTYKPVVLNLMFECGQLDF